MGVNIDRRICLQQIMRLLQEIGIVRFLRAPAARRRQPRNARAGHQQASAIHGKAIHKNSRAVDQ